MKIRNDYLKLEFFMTLYPSIMYFYCVRFPRIRIRKAERNET